MKQRWQIKKLGEVCLKCNNIKWDVAEKDATFQYIDLTSVDRDDLCIHNPQTINKNNAPSRAKQIIRTGDVIFATTRPTLRRVSLIDEKYNNAICSTGFCVLRPNNEVLPQFVFYALQEDGFYKYIEPLQTGASYPAVTDGVVKNYLISVPPLFEQQRIVNLLDAEFPKIDIIKANAGRNLQNARDLFQAALKKELESKDGWKTTTIGEICVLKSGNSNANNSADGSLPFVKVGDMNNEGNEEFITCSSRYVDYNENTKSVFPIGTVIFPKRGGAILTNKKRLTAVEVCCDLNVMGVYAKTDIIPSYLYYYFQGIDLSKIYDGAAIPQINNGDISPLPISYPLKTSSQQNIVTRLDELKKKCKTLQANYEKTIALCDDLKQALLRKAFNGEI